MSSSPETAATDQWLHEAEAWLKHYGKPPKAKGADPYRHILGGLESAISLLERAGELMRDSGNVVALVDIHSKAQEIGGIVQDALTAVAENLVP